MILISWDRITVVKDGRVVEEYRYPEDEILDILNSIMEGDLKAIKYILEKYPDEEIKFVGKVDNIEKMRNTAISLAKYRMRKKLKQDSILEQILALYDDLVSTINLLGERVMEMKKIEEILGEELEECGLLKEELSRLVNMREYLGERIRDYAERIAPNLTALLGPLLAARVIHHAGGLERLASMPASTIQVLGAENAFFQHLKKGTPCPKHGIIYQYPNIRNAPRKIRGKIARALAGKIAIAARVDFYGGEFVGDKLKDTLIKRMEEIKNDTRGKGR